jgi:hypothetical protein
LQDEDFLADLGLGDDLTEGPAPLAGELLAAHQELALVLAAWPLLWSVWAGLTRGGLGLKLAGIALLGREGRPAARWRCALRALLLWLPVAVLLWVSLLLDLWRVAQAAVGGWSDEQVRVTAWLAWAAWWLALLLLPLYAWVAVRWPNGGPHDRLTGTYPVPR